MVESSLSLRLRVELRALREQLSRMAEEHRRKKAVEFDVAYFAASMRLSNLEAINERLAVSTEAVPAEVPDRRGGLHGDPGGLAAGR